MDQLDLLRATVEALERLDIRYAVVGSFASGAWGEPHLTNDIDIVVEVDIFDARSICREFPPPDFYISEAAAEEAVDSCGQFNLIHNASGGKVDLMVLDRSKWSSSQLKRSIRAPLLPDRTVSVAQAEDVILGKLLDYQEGGLGETRPRHHRDPLNGDRRHRSSLPRQHCRRDRRRAGVAFNLREARCARRVEVSILLRSPPFLEHRLEPRIRGRTGSRLPNEQAPHVE